MRRLTCDARFGPGFIAHLVRPISAASQNVSDSLFFMFLQVNDHISPFGRDIRAIRVMRHLIPVT
jgi:hypothetical protein